MPKRKHTAEEIINKLREVAATIATGSTVAEAARHIGVAERTIHRWWAEYGGLLVDSTIRPHTWLGYQTEVRRLACPQGLCP